MPTSRKIIHLDCDCFYAAVEMHERPELTHRPIAVGGDPQRRGVIATCNYPARRFGIHSAMASAYALKLCPELIILPPRFDKYRAVSQQIMAIYRRYTDVIEPLSLDEAYLDVTDSPHHHNSATLMAEAIRAEVKEQVGITVSAGVAPNKFLAKVASDWRKPDGLFVIEPNAIEAFMPALPVKRIPGVGRVTEEKLTALGITTCQQLQALSRFELHEQFGNFGEKLYEYSRGTDARPVQSSRRRKSVSVEETYPQDLPQLSQWQAALEELCERLQQRLQRLDHHYLVQGTTVKVRYHDFTIRSADGPAGPIHPDTFKPLLAALWKRRQAPIRLLGVGVRLRDETTQAQKDMFEEEKRRALLAHHQR